MGLSQRLRDADDLNDERRSGRAHRTRKGADSQAAVESVNNGYLAAKSPWLTAALQSVPDGEERVIVATGHYLGEGFDDARLDTLFLTMPISWRGTLAQYAGRLHRLHAAKREVVIFDYVDGHEPLLAKMATRREAGYRALGYEVINAGDLFSPRNSALRKERRLISTVFWLGGVDELVDVARMA